MVGYEEKEGWEQHRLVQLEEQGLNLRVGVSVSCCVGSWGHKLCCEGCWF